MHSETVTRAKVTAEVSVQVLPAARTDPRFYFAGAVYAVLVALAIWRHEPWADEAQSWLLARDASLADLWGRLLHYEGTPGLWQTLLHALIGLGLPYSAYNFVSGFLGLVAVCLLLRYAPLPLFIRILLPFTYYLCYQYAVVARSYALVAPLLFAIAAIYTSALRRPAAMTVLLCLLAGVSVHGFLLSVCIWVSVYAPALWRAGRPKVFEPWKLAIAGLAYWAILGFYALCAWPARDVAFAEHRGFANLYLFPDVAKASFVGAFTGHWLASLALIALSAPFLWRGGGWLVLLLTSAALCLFGTIVYSQAWHLGILFLAWLFAIWISAYKTRITAPVVLALSAAIAIQCYWTAMAIGYDWKHSYSGSLAASQYLRQAGLPRGGIYAVGYPSTALQPYFSANLYSDFHNGGHAAYWDWSKQNTANDPVALFGSPRRDLVVVGYTEIPVEKRWANLLDLLGYGLDRHFDGATFWKTDVFERESFDLYRKASNSRAISSVSMADAEHAAQLLSGFYNIEAGAWRWTAKSFSVLFKSPTGAARNGADLELKLFLPDAQVQRLGAITLSAEAGGHSLPAHTFTASNTSAYSAHVPAEALQTDFVVVNFQLDKAAVNVNGDERELGVVVTAVGLDAVR